MIFVSHDPVIALFLNSPRDPVTTEHQEVFAGSDPGDTVASSGTWSVGFCRGFEHGLVKVLIPGWEAKCWR